MGRFKAFWSTTGTKPCIPAEGMQGAQGQVLQHDPPLVFDLDSDPAESSPVQAPSQVLHQLEEARRHKVADIASSFQSQPLYEQGGRTAQPCCNATSVYCGCAGSG